MARGRGHSVFRAAFISPSVVFLLLNFQARKVFFSILFLEFTIARLLDHRARLMRDRSHNENEKEETAKGPIQGIFKVSRRRVKNDETESRRCVSFFESTAKSTLHRLLRTQNLRKLDENNIYGTHLFGGKIWQDGGDGRHFFAHHLCKRVDSCGRHRQRSGLRHRATHLRRSCERCGQRPHNFG